ncbi:phosphatase PAP2 family protein [Dechloromonas sp. XY25]|uniref:Phosphatase PAP2 family protein n=1 Tax=Dechloromonas hankyongensis TaxID=2908002 RepID=A0ABS9JZW0_9RHOO|nr:phosphatase PAP2 family protein [Dechloromonas hankyongensis]MCG2576445.1 phosphatase PAP2 family protein [Dechloromonas hankyongensis]
MKDDALYARHPWFDAGVLISCLLLAVALLGVWLSDSWQGGFLAGQAVGSHLPPILWESLTTLGDARVQLALMLPFCLRYPRVFWALFLGALIAGAVSRGFKMAVPLPRPAAVFDAAQITIIGAKLTAHSFPSGHTVSAFSFVVAWMALLGWRAALLVALAALAGFSRVAVGAHWPVDVLAGAMVGLLGGWLGLRLSQHFRWGLGVRAHWFLIAISVVAVATLPFDGQGYPGSLPWRIAACLWGLGGFAAVYLLPLFKDGWGGVNRDLACVVAANSDASGKLAR